MITTFIDSGVLIAFARGQGLVAQRAFQILNDPARLFLSSALVQLEVLPKCVYNRRHIEAEIYRTFFQSVSVMIPITEAVLAGALQRASRLGLQALDAIHLESALSAGAETFITTEKSTKPIFRESALKVQGI